MPLDILGNKIISVAVSPYGVYRSRIIRDGLVLYLDAADVNSYNGGNIWYDLSGNGNNGTLVNLPTWSTTNGGNFYFDGVSSQKITVPIGGSPTCYCFEVAIRQWKEASSNISFVPYYSNIGLTSNGYTTAGLNIGEWSTSMTNETVSWRNDNSQQSGSYVTNTITYSYHIYSFNWVDGVNYYDFYLDGVRIPMTASTVVGSHTDLMTIITNINIGYSNAIWGYYFKGDIGFVRMYNRSLHPYEVAENFQAQRGRIGI